jgi:GT2 family glycosyltransferase
MFTVRAFGHKIQEIIDANPEYSTFTCMTNRVMTPYQRLMEHWYNNDMSEHWEIGANRWDTFHTKVKDVTDEQPFSGVMILTQKKTWEAVGGFREGHGMLGIDNQYHLDCKEKGFKVGLMQGIYLMHYYRNGNPSDKAHLL